MTRKKHIDIEIDKLTNSIENVSYYSNNMKKLKPEPIDVDLYVAQKTTTEKELQAFSEFIEEYKRKQAKKSKHKKAA